MTYTLLCVSIIYVRKGRYSLLTATLNNAEYISIHYMSRIDELAKMAEFVLINKLLFAMKYAMMAPAFFLTLLRRRLYVPRNIPSALCRTAPDCPDR